MRHTAQPPQMPADGYAATPELRDLAQKAAGEGAERASAIAELRAAGPDGLAAVLEAAAREPAGPRADRLRDAVDHVAAQRDASSSRLYWYTDLDEAKRAARASGRPILSLRLLGRLDDELSCANSRFFRTA